MRKVFDNFDPEMLVKYDNAKIDGLTQDAGIIRRSAKIEAVVSDARVYFEVKKQYGSLDFCIFIGQSPCISQQVIETTIVAINSTQR
jgi:DNA-3-methyladenine glycosylase I